MTIDKRLIVLNGEEFTLGQKYRNTLLGNEGIATAGCQYLTGCDQLRIEWNDSTGRPVAEWVDVSLIDGVNVKQKPGGPAPNMPARHP